MLNLLAADSICEEIAQQSSGVEPPHHFSARAMVGMRQFVLRTTSLPSGGRSLETLDGTRAMRALKIVLWIQLFLGLVGGYMAFAYIHWGGDECCVGIQPANRV